ncbi:kinase-like domain-containing protein [Suillus subaureus]|uniref:Kinase-like domain-containing protein n=1 Tax=Suillus subaureus TaxID=48587 RepID=A0A9P7EF60_9AGAM|nr:kinase-like domain-containing protein [Suillus subaureus]KAG1819810.1 kinase-like domain-containing protein [Suillus subaureus]
MLDDPSEVRTEKIHPELQLLSSRLLPHDNVVQFLGFKKDKLFHSLVMPWMADGTLTSFIRTHGAALEIPAKTTLLCDISSGLEHLHLNFVVHGNLESDNILITERQGACLSGFRQSVRLSSRDAACPQSQMPSKPAIQFTSPEWFVQRDDAIFQHLPKTLFKSDIYSLGCVIFYIYTKRMPWHDATSVDISNQLRKRVTPSRPKGPIVDDDQWALIEPYYQVFIGPPDLTGQIKRQRDYADAHGGCGSVYESIWNRKTGGQVKVMHVEDSSRVDEVKKNLKRELAAWRRLSHPNIASLLGTTTDFGHLEGMVGMVSLWMKNGSLYAYMGNRDVDDHPIVHGDLTPLNVLIDDNERAVLTDFGLSVILGGFTNLSVTYTDAKIGGALAWAAPELFPDHQADSKGPNPSPSSDVYSFACLMYLIFTGSRLWPDITGLNTMMRAKTGRRPSNPGTIDHPILELD